MPTFSRAVAAIALAALFWLVSELVKPLLPDGIDPKYLSAANAAIALVVGWNLTRGRVGGGFVAAPALGLTVVISGGVVVLFLQSVAEMLRHALDRRYDGPFEAIVNVFEMMVDYAMMSATWQTGTLLLGGALVIGYLSEATHRVLD